jgi:AcrR family transcriptional regulator
LVDAALELARPAGADAIVLREVTRRAGVTPRAAYRHFVDRDDLVQAVAQRALSLLAAAIEQRMAALAEPDGRAMLQAVGESYITFALDDPGLFDVAFFAMDDMVNTAAPESKAACGLSPFQLLEAALEKLVREGLLPAADVGDAVITCWSGVHGFATLTALGPLRELPRHLVDDQSTRLVRALVDAVAGRTLTG